MTDNDDKHPLVMWFINLGYSEEKASQEAISLLEALQGLCRFIIWAFVVGVLAAIVVTIGAALS